MGAASRMFYTAKNKEKRNHLGNPVSLSQLKLLRHNFQPRELNFSLCLSHSAAELLRATLSIKHKSVGAGKGREGVPGERDDARHGEGAH